jgi:hypothetical protein
VCSAVLSCAVQAVIYEDLLQINPVVYAELLHLHMMAVLSTTA